MSNEGLEIPEGELANIFQKFYRLDAARSTRTGGAGLGLSMVRKIAQAHGGYMTLDSIPGLGSTFALHLPLEGMELKEKI